MERSLSLRLLLSAETRQPADPYFKVNGNRSAANFAIIGKSLVVARGGIHRDRDLSEAVGACERVFILNGWHKEGYLSFEFMMCPQMKRPLTVYQSRQGILLCCAIAGSS